MFLYLVLFKIYLLGYFPQIGRYQFNFHVSALNVSL